MLVLRLKDKSNVETLESADKLCNIKKYTLANKLKRFAFNSFKFEIKFTHSH